MTRTHQPGTASASGGTPGSPKNSPDFRIIRLAPSSLGTGSRQRGDFSRETTCLTLPTVHPSNRLCRARSQRNWACHIGLVPFCRIKESWTR
jgi:hypothetical protein